MFTRLGSLKCMSLLNVELLIRAYVYYILSVNFYYCHKNFMYLNLLYFLFLIMLTSYIFSVSFNKYLIQRIQHSSLCFSYGICRCEYISLFFIRSGWLRIIRNMFSTYVVLYHLLFWSPVLST